MSLRIFAAVVLVACVAGCENGETSRLNNPNTPYLAASSGSAASQGTSGYDPISYWDGDGVSGAPSVELHLSEQRAYFYKGGQLVGVSQISTGREGHDTPPGSYKIIQKDPNHASSLYGDYVDAAGNIVQKDVELGKDPKPPGAIFKGAPMPNFMRITGGVGLHEGYLPGYPASHGCIRMPGKMAQIFYNNVSLGTPVTVYK
ncbi:MAG: L,D-transpeptidase family protein [Verrucomicrobia bacterium]|nr:L,D-transpeptidase family protein [Verrucomicrobiota bacterium]MBV8274431.1 L,D-transpeptidase family protein [Verrucomicrobiota bacterium]